MGAINTTHIGSFPFDNTDEAIAFAKQFSLPCLPSLPNLNPNEFMLAQVSNGIDQLQGIEDYQFPFSCLDAFISDKEILNRNEMKWQILGPITLIQSLNPKPDDKQIESILYWYRNKIINFQKFLLTFFKKVYLFLDEPVLEFIKHKNYDLLDDFVSLLDLPKEGSVLGLHCCSRADWKRLLGTTIMAYSFDLQFMDSESFTLLSSNQKLLFVGVVKTDSCAVLELDFKAFKLENNKDNIWVTPTCGLALTDKDKVDVIPRLLDETKLIS